MQISFVVWTAYMHFYYAFNVAILHLIIFLSDPLLK